MKYIKIQMKQAKTHLEYYQTNDEANRKEFLDDEAKYAEAKETQNA